MSEAKHLPESLRPIFNRRSVRLFRPDPLPEAHVALLVESMRRAPSAGNRQPWHFYLVKNQQLKNALVDAAHGQEFLAQAPLLFVICAIPRQSASRYGRRGEELYVYQDTAAAAENLLLAATALGYGSCWVGAFDEKRVAQTLNLPQSERPVALIPVGKPAENPPSTPRLETERVLTVLE